MMKQMIVACPSLNVITTKSIHPGGNKRKLYSSYAVESARYLYGYERVHTNNQAETTTVKIKIMGMMIMRMMVMMMKRMMFERILQIKRVDHPYNSSLLRRIP